MLGSLLKYLNFILSKAGFFLIRKKLLDELTEFNKVTGSSVFNFINQTDSLIRIKTIFDVGANVGQSALKYDQHFPHSIVQAFEPIEQTYNSLISNTKEKNNIHPHQLGLSDAPCTKKIHTFNHENAVWNSLDDEVQRIAREAGGHMEEVHISTIDIFMQSHNISRIDFLKIDTEAHDLSVLKGARKALESKKILYIYCEVTFQRGNPHNSQYNSIADYLDNYEFKLMGFFDHQWNWQESRYDNCNALFRCDTFIP